MLSKVKLTNLFAALFIVNFVTLSHTQASLLSDDEIEIYQNTLSQVNQIERMCFVVDAIAIAIENPNIIATNCLVRVVLANEEKKLLVMGAKGGGASNHIIPNIISSLQCLEGMALVGYLRTESPYILAATVSLHALKYGLKELYMNGYIGNYNK